MNFYFCIAIALLGGLTFTKVANFLKVPNVTGYLLAGLILGPNFFNVLNIETSKSLTILTTIALGLIAFSIGNEFKISHIKKIGTKAIVITIFESLCAVLLVDVVLILVGLDKAAAITLGAMAATTAPAATLLVVKQYNAKGVVTDNLLSVVAMDDAIGLITYSVSGEQMEITTALLIPIFKIIMSMSIGIFLGFLVSVLHKVFKDKPNRLIISLAFVILSLYIAEKFDLSNLLICMCLSAAFVNMSSESLDTISVVEKFTPPIFMLFFVISGAELNLKILQSVGIFGIIYIICRVLGKYIGTYIGASIVKSDEKVKKYLGIALMPQAGVAIGMSQLALSQLPQYGAQIQTVILSSIFVYELIGPVCAKIALKKAGEIKN